jgi:hypothetical protein
MFVKTGVGGLIVRLKVLSAVEAPLLALTTKDAVPAAVGVPERTPFDARERPSVCPLELTKLYPVTGLASRVVE